MTSQFPLKPLYFRQRLLVTPEYNMLANKKDWADNVVYYLQPAELLAFIYYKNNIT